MKVKLSGSFRRYLVAHNRSPSLLERLRATLANTLQEYRFRSIDQASNEMRSVGWCTPDGQVPASFEEYDPWLGSALYVGIRIDQKRVPAGALKVRRLEAEAVERRDVGERIPPARRRELAEKIQSELLTRSVPTTSVHTMLWDVASAQLLFSSTAEATQQAFAGLFRASFEELGVSLVGLTAVSLPAHIGLPQDELRRLETAHPLSIV